ncbi:MAG: hypothetical protein MZV64_71860 [Ignavibacteriales bacterium]|nr:hypothetical protein [Ignavibacteriales bacterium]
MNVTGLKGGHSGVDIHLGPRKRQQDPEPDPLACGKKARTPACIHRRRKPAQCASRVNPSPWSAIPAANKEGFLKCLGKHDGIRSNKELSAVEPDLKIEAVPADLPARSLIDEITQNNLHECHLRLPERRDAHEQRNGRPGGDLHATWPSSNRRTAAIRVMCLLRSSVDSAKDDLEQMMQSRLRTGRSRSWCSTASTPDGNPTPISDPQDHAGYLQEQIAARSPRSRPSMPDSNAGCSERRLPELGHDLLRTRPSVTRIRRMRR